MIKDDKLILTAFGRPATAKNGMTVVFRGGRSTAIKKPSLQRWEEETTLQFRGAAKRCGISEPIDFPINLCVEVWPWRDGRCDLVGYIQAVNDVLVKAGVIVDDSALKPEVVVSHDGSKVVGVDKKNPRVTVTIRPI